MHGHKGEKGNGGSIPINAARPHAEDAADAQTADAQAAGPGADTGSAEVETLKEALRQAEDKYVRLYAETENFKKRMSRD